MPPPDPRTTRQHLGLTAGQAARLFGVDGRAWRRMETEGAEPRGPLARLLAIDTVGGAGEIRQQVVGARNWARYRYTAGGTEARQDQSIEWA